MLKQKQKFKHDPDNDVWGDCFRTCIASLLDLDANIVPHFAHGCNTTEEWEKCYQQTDEWLKERGLYFVQIPLTGDLETILEMMNNSNPTLNFLICGESKNGTNHNVVCRGGEIVCDPSLDDSGIVGPTDEGVIWVEFLVPLSQLETGE